MDQPVHASQRQLLLMFVAYHPSRFEVQQLQDCLSQLSPQVGYAVVVNDHQPGEPVDALATCADLFLTNFDNPGYGRAVNRLVTRFGQLPPYIGVLNIDLSWQPGTFEQLLGWLQQHPQVNLAVPQILDENNICQKLCKHHPTVLGLLSRRFLPTWLKPTWLKRYDRWYMMADHNYQDVFDVPYLSGCCMLIRSEAFRRIGGFDERYFLYLEDADLTRSLARFGRCVHLPVAAVIHGWGRGNYRNLGLMVVNLASAWHYFRKWGWQLW
ncbi:glycosyltransferase family 2 protein [Synechococcus sp. HK05]|nr:glycosyltransferase family 2 protein [Synechococcus sp. HK05]